MERISATTDPSFNSLVDGWILANSPSQSQRVDRLDVVDYFRRHFEHGGHVEALITSGKVQFFRICHPHKRG